uniref:Allantoate amidinohydrolase n=1 Tax=Culicoides sonorensis TaxID=179676 RepID=A0A336M292_CULSO
MEVSGRFNNLASSSNFASVLFATDDFFAPAENLLKDSEPVWNPEKFTEFGKWMDGWETRRKRIPGHDWCIIKLAAPCVIKGVLVDTAHFSGNYVPKISVQAAFLSLQEESWFPIRKESIGSACTKTDLDQVKKINTDKWNEIVPKTQLGPGCEETRKTFIIVNSNDIFTHVRLNYYPDGGVARFKVFGDVKINIPASIIIDLMALLNGGQCLKYSNAHYGHPKNLISPSKGFNMADGWETARRLDRPAVLEVDANGILNNVPGQEWCIFKLGRIGVLEYLLIDTNHFKGNFPYKIRVEGTKCNESEFNEDNCKWELILVDFKLSGHTEHTIRKDELKNLGPFSHVKIIIAPDGGISRVRMFGYVL